QKWYVPKFDSSKIALAYGDECWSRVLSHWQQYLDEGLTEHRNWWPELYRDACKKWKVRPDPNALAFDTSYCATRADLQEWS
ncbi:MAG: hypothetical protein AAF483_24820, partial [Planctomycetota bacterium]